ncbi:MAG: hypothetical protein HY673_10400 [Chloroflexi bacterium]|nr:hypothetical protein [Chloroflexota bacterium]
MIVGHHSHTMRGIEMYKRRAPAFNMTKGHEATLMTKEPGAPGVFA